MQERGPDADMEFIYGQHSQMSYRDFEQQQQQMQKEFAQDMLKNMFQVDIDLDDLDEQKMADLEEQFNARFATEPPATPAQEERENKVRQELQNMTKATRALYMRLMKLLHPDRATSDDARSRNTELTQRVTAAYQGGDFFELLRLHHEHLTGEQALDAVADEELKYYNKALLDQIRELNERLFEQTRWGVEGAFYQRFGGTPNQMKQRFGREQARLEQSGRRLENDLAVFKDLQQLRAFLRTYRPVPEFDLDTFL